MYLRVRKPQPEALQRLAELLQRQGAAAVAVDRREQRLRAADAAAEEAAVRAYGGLQYFVGGPGLRHTS